MRRSTQGPATVTQVNLRVQDVIDSAALILIVRKNDTCRFSQCEGKPRLVKGLWNGDLLLDLWAPHDPLIFPHPLSFLDDSPRRYTAIRQLSSQDRIVMYSLSAMMRSMASGLSVGVWGVFVSACVGHEDQCIISVPEMLVNPLPKKYLASVKIVPGHPEDDRLTRSFSLPAEAECPPDGADDFCEWYSGTSTIFAMS